MYAVRKQTFKELKPLERESLKYCKCDGKVTFTRHFLMLDKVTFGEYINALERWYIVHIYKTLIALFPKLKV